LKRRKEIIPMFEMTEIEKLQSSSSAIPILPSIPPASEGGSLIP